MMYYGAQYYRPPFPGRICWDRDMKHMKELGFNVVKLWAVWNAIETNENEFNFEELDELVEIANENGLGVIINTIPEGAPYWTASGNEDAFYETNTGHKVTYGGPANLPTAGWPGLCMDKPEAEQLVCRFLENTAKHFKDNKAIVSIDVWNEPHLEPMFDYRDEILCYCTHSSKKFITWLQKKYVNIESLNKAWFRTYNDWSQVCPPPRFGTWADMMDWRLFWLDNMAGWLRSRAAAIKKGAPNIKTQTHVAYSGYLGNNLNGGLANELGDEFMLAKEVDIFGLTSFPKWLMKENSIYKHMMQNEIVAEASEDKPFYQVELQGGGGKAGLLGGAVPTKRDIYLWNYHTVMMGGKGSVYWQYAPEPSGIEAPGFGLTGLKGEDTERSIAAGECARILNQPILQKAKRIKPSNAIYISRHTEVLTYSAGREDGLYVESINGFYKGAYRSGIPMGFVHEDQLEDILATGTLKTLYLPLAITLSKKEVNNLKEFVKRGGTLVSEACPGLFDEAGTLDADAYALETLFGLEHKDLTEVDLGEEILLYHKASRESYKGAHYKQTVEILADVDIIACYGNGSPAATVQNIGEGRAVWFGTLIAGAYHLTDDILTETLLMSFADRGGYEIIEKISLPKERDSELREVVLRLLETEDKYVLVGVNHHYKDVEVTVDFKLQQKLQENKDMQNKLVLHIKSSDGVYFAWKK